MNVCWQRKIFFFCRNNDNRTIAMSATTACERLMIYRWWFSSSSFCSLLRFFSLLDVFKKEAIEKPLFLYFFLSRFFLVQRDIFQLASVFYRCYDLRKTISLLYSPVKIEMTDFFLLFLSLLAFPSIFFSE